MDSINRREFVEKAAVVAGAIALGTTAEAEDVQKTPKLSDKIKLGKTGLTSSLLGIGTGSVGWNKASNQTRLGQKKFT
jgi:1-deoxyxylulose-5-phosphate synthase